MTSSESISRVQDLCRLFCPERGEAAPELDFVREPVRWTHLGKRAIFSGDGWIFAWVLDEKGKITGFREWERPGVEGYVTLPDKAYRWRDGIGVPLRTAAAGRKREIFVTNYPALLRARDCARLERLDSVSVWGLTPRTTDSAVQIGWDWLAWRGSWGRWEFRGIVRCTV